MALYPIIKDFPTSWNNPRELGVPVTVAGREIVAVPSQDSITGDLELGMGFEAQAPYVLCRLQDVDDLGNLHGAAVTIDNKNYVVRNVRPKENIDLVRLVLSQRK